MERTRLNAGKLPPELLSELLDSCAVADPDPRLLVGPQVGEDCAVLDLGDRLLLVKSDPITFAADRIGWYAVQVNANDIACSGGRPRWFLPTILLPPASSPDDARRIFADLAAACRALGVSIIGGHTEVTVGIPRPIIAGTMLGEVAPPDRLITTGGAQDGDSIIVTTGLAIEGTAILARECAGALSAAGVSAAVIARAADYLTNPGISVVAAARTLCDAATIHSMHDITEGGVITALREVAAAARLGLVAEAESMPVLPESAAICTALGLDPLGLLGSGALIATLPAAEVPRALRGLDAIGVTGWEVGQMMEASDGLWLIDRAGEHTLPEFARDELARYLETADTPPPAPINDDDAAAV